MELPEIAYTRPQLIARSIILFFSAIFLFLAAGTEIIDVAKAYLDIELSPRIALTIVSLIYIAVWFVLGMWENMGTKGSVGLPLVTAILIILASLAAEANVGIFGEWDKFFQHFNTVTIAVAVLVNSLYAALYDYMKRSQANA